MTNAIVKHSDIIHDLDELQRVARMYAVSKLFASKGDNNEAIAQIATQIMAGRELGLGPFASVQGIHIIQGRPSLSANLMAAAVKSHPHYNYKVREMSDKNVSIEFFEDGESLGISSFSAADAAKADTKNMGKFPRNMLFARAMSNGVRWFCPDVFNGSAVYTPDELGAAVDDDGEYIAATQNGNNGYHVIEQPTEKPTTDTEHQVFDDLVATAKPETQKALAAATKSAKKAAKVEPTEETPPVASADNDEVAAIIKEHNLTAPPATQAWAVNQHYCGNDYHARNRWLNIVKQDFGGKLTSEIMSAVIRAFVADCLAKGIEQNPVAV